MRYLHIVLLRHFHIAVGQVAAVYHQNIWSQNIQLFQQVHIVASMYPLGSHAVILCFGDMYCKARTIFVNDTPLHLEHLIRVGPHGGRCCPNLQTTVFGVVIGFEQTMQVCFYIFYFFAQIRTGAVLNAGIHGATTNDSADAQFLYRLTDTICQTWFAVTMHIVHCGCHTAVQRFHHSQHCCMVGVFRFQINRCREHHIGQPIFQLHVISNAFEQCLE